ncbi:MULTISPECIES: sigma-70 family RNA polymerase sigma factor [unclassified Nostoc]|uniref:sigma-70 family RNA polymerase sigma factor n=1 Tax=unclassified Nostoc TaxID=2593658 RepID=UPI0025AB2C54|nr:MULTISPECIES: sigma-70 family RNA polymerase sigma factor [unclassified Nostoc]MDM9581711.1 sigma-70 family RNA polymerase sigma factor [Nostoc sp. GT001]MDZ7946646.1 sigma-70 family RNA polymerase sigma factor [Nostoc sp. EfeVER01]MDZ7995435.1 sigma-70 family RNA polymerase sigma factor [Nostoc sp. EspVER01]
MQIPHFPEANHPLVKSLFHHSDHELLTLFQRYPDAGKYFTVIFCRYSPIVYTLIRHSARSPVQADYLFALTWRHIYYELGGLKLTDSESGEEALTMQNWLINMTAFCINEIKLPPTEAIHYSLQATSPPLWCYVQQALDQLPPILRLIVLMAQTFHWSETRIAAYLQAEGEAIAPNEVANFLQEGYRMLEDKLPTDIRAIYFGEDLAQSQLK